MITSLQWFLGWLPRGALRRIEDLESILDLIFRIEYQESDEEDDADDDE